MKLQIIVVLLVTCVPFALAEKPPYDKFPDAEPPYYRVRYEASEKPGELIFPVKYTIWVPPGVKVLRGLIVHQHGCGEGSCKSGLTGAWDLHWQALAKKHDCALMAPSYEQPQKADCQMWCDPRNGSAETFKKSLGDLAELSGHPELETVPWALWGHSGGGHWAGGMVMLYPERIAAAWLRSGVPFLEADPDRPAITPYGDIPAASLKVPMMCNPGTREGVTVKEGRFARVWPMNKTFLSTMRKKSALIGVSIDPLSAHECGNQRYMSIPWLDACLSARLPDKPSGKLKPMPEHDIWLAPFLAKTAIPEKEFKGDRSQASWLQSEKVAALWMHYVRDTEIPDTTPPPAPTNVRVEEDTITWQAESDLESGLAHFIIRRDGRFLAKIEGAKHRYGRPLFQSLLYSDTPVFPLQEMIFRDSAQMPGKQHRYKVISVNTVGLKSE